MIKTILTCLMFTQTIFCFGQNTLDEPKRQSIISLIANTENYIEKRVILRGFLNIAKEDMAIYLSKDDYVNYNTKNAIYLYITIDDINRLDMGKMNKKYISIEGTFCIPKFKDKNMDDRYVGALKNIEYVELLEQRK